MISNRALQRSFCRKGFFYKAGINRLTLTNRTYSGFATVDPNIGPQMLAYPNMMTGMTMKTDTVELDAILEEIRSNDDFALHHKLAEEVALVSSQVVNKRKLDLLYADPELHTVLNNAHQTSLLTRQIQIEEEQQNAAVVHYNESLKQLITMGRGTGLKYIQRVLLKWYEPLTRVLDAEISLIESRVVGPDRTQYGPCLLLLPAEKLAVITLDECLNSVLRIGNNGVQLTSLSRRIGELIEAEVSIIKLQKGKIGLRPWQNDVLKKMYSDNNFRKTRQKLNQLVDEDVWPTEMKVKVGAALISFLLDSAKTDQDLPAFQYSKKLLQRGTYKRVGILLLDQDLYLDLSGREGTNMAPRFLPMLLPPKLWENKSKTFNDGCYFRLRSSLMRTVSKAQTEALRKANMNGILDGLDYLGKVGWRINTGILDVAQEAYSKRLVFGDLPILEVAMPDKTACVRVVPTKNYKTVFTFKNQEVPKTDDLEDDHEDDPELLPWDKENGAEHSPQVEKKKKKTQSESESKSKSSEKPVDPTVPRFDSKYYEELCRRTIVKNASIFSMRCDLELKFWVAEKFRHDTFYYPYNLDFRGRAYPVPPNLNHLGSDLCRALLLFEVEKPLGESGMHWLKVHLSNLCGNNKVSHTDRVAFADENMENIMDSAKNPLGGNMWWSKAEEPFQALATCIEITKAVESGDPSTYMCRLPVHQDGSCNGLQHYAALGRDAVGASAVNVRPSNKPQDVYTSVLNIVIQKIGADVDKLNNNPDAAEATRGAHALMVRDVVDRKVIKQTVMTSVYGVTKVGARAQIQARLHEKLFTDATKITTPEVETQLFGAASYLASLTLESLQEMFTSAKDIMDWLGTCATLVATQNQAMAWVTPLGLPVIQPYRRTATHTVRTILQSITLSLDDDALPVSKQKQRTAFPPNFVHSLDATHMLMTTLKMRDQDIVFAAVHDSYWTHADDIPKMNVAIRECFFDLYDEPILERLMQSLTTRYPDVTFPPVPKRGTLDLKQVKESPYFFH